MGNVRLLSILRLSLLLGASGLVAVACTKSSSGSSGSGGEGTSTPGGCFDYTGFDETTPTVTFKADVLPIFQNSCGLSMSCHGANPPTVPSQMFLGPALPAMASSTDIAAIFAGAVGVKSVDDSDMDIIDPGSPESSFLMYKVDSDPMSVNGVTCSTLTCAAPSSATPCLSGMPLDGDQLSLADRDTIRRWIAQGAKND
jgi:hypothetical protein